jgi:hypothetical protein
MKPSPRIEPLPPQHSPELEETFGRFKQALGFIANSMLIRNVSTMPFARPHFNEIYAAIDFAVSKDYPARGEA